MHFEYDPLVEALDLELNQSTHMLMNVDEDLLSDQQRDEYHELTRMYTYIKELVLTAARHRLRYHHYSEEEIASFQNKDLLGIVLSSRVTNNLLNIIEDFEDQIAEWKASTFY